jgi:hypothetical protein
MSWLRIDDNFPQHPKFEGWRAVDKWSWLEMMAYCARFSTGGRIPSDPQLWPRSVTQKLLDLALISGWIDERVDGLWIHDFELYNPSHSAGAERARRYRERKKLAAERDVTRDAERDDDRDASRDAFRAGAGARVRPRPVPVQEEPSVSPTRARDSMPDGLTDIASDIDEQLTQLRHSHADEGGEP